MDPNGSEPAAPEAGLGAPTPGSRVSDYEYSLPEGRIAAYPSPVRGESRLLHLPRYDGSVRHLKFGGGPTGLNNLAVSVGEDAGTLEEVYEPFLIQKGFLMRTPQGRVATARAFERIGVDLPDPAGPGAGGRQRRSGTEPGQGQSSLFED